MSAINERRDLSMYEVPLSLLGFGMGTMLSNFHMCVVLCWCYRSLGVYNIRILTARVARSFMVRSFSELLIGCGRSSNTIFFF